MTGRGNVALTAHALAVYGFLFAPILVLIVFSFSASAYSGVWGGFSLEWYVKLWHNERLQDVLANSLLIAISAALLSVVIGTSAAIALSNRTTRWRHAVRPVMFLPVVMPELALGIALLLLFSFLVPIPLGRITIIIAHSVIGSAYVALTVGSRLRDHDVRLTEAARDLGASHWQAFRRITLPLIWPAVLGGGLLAFTLSFDDFVLAFFVTGPGVSTLPLEIYSMVKRGVTPEINALATAVLVLSVILVALSQWIQRGAAFRSSET